MKLGKRPRLNPKTEIAVWAAAAGRCTFCNRLVLENEDTGLIVPIEERSSADNLLLLCRNCHKPIDDNGVIGCYTVEVLQRFKQEHEARIRYLTEIDADRKALVIRLVGSIRGVNPELTYETVLAATTAAGVFPATLPNAYRNAIEIDLREYGEGNPDIFRLCTARINACIVRINEGIKLDQISRLAVFAFARIPLLVHLGAQLDDKVLVLLFQRQRVNDKNAWRWPLNPPEPPPFQFDKLQDGDVGHVAFVLNISGTIHLQDLPYDIQTNYTIYRLMPTPPLMSGPTIISSPAALTNFEHAVRGFLAHVEKEHRRIPTIAVFPALPISCAIALGQTLMPHISPSLALFDRDEHGEFFRALEVRR